MHTNNPQTSKSRRQQQPQPHQHAGPSHLPHPSQNTVQQNRAYSPEPTSRYGPAAPQAPALQAQQQPGNAPPRITKLDQIIQNFYTKVAQVVIQARLTHHDGQPLILPQTTTSTGSTASTRSVASSLGASKQGGGTGGKKTNKWFNLEMDDLDLFKDELKFWRTTATTQVGTMPPPPMIIELYLDTSELTQSQVLVVIDETMRRNRVDLAGSGSGGSFVGGRHGGGDGYGQRSILLESWMLNLTQPCPDPPPDLPVVYKKSIIFFRSLYAYVRLLPAFQLQRRLRKMKGLANLRLGYRLVAAPTLRNDEIPIGVSIVDSDSRQSTSDYRFGSIDTPLGVFSLTVIYRINCNFQVDDSERDLSYRLLDMEEDYFVPTMVVEYRKGQDLIERSKKRNSLDERRAGLEENFGPSGIGGERMVRGQSKGSRQASSGLSAMYDQSHNRVLPEAADSPPTFSPQRTTRRTSLRSRGSSSSLSSSPPKNPPVASGRNLAAYAASLGIEDTSGTSHTGLSPSTTGPVPTPSSIGRRPSISSIVSPFKSPFLASSPTQHELIPIPSTSGQRGVTSSLQKSSSFSSLNQRLSHERTPSHSSSSSSSNLPRPPAPSSSTGRSTSQQPVLVPQFSSSFERYRYAGDRSSPTRDGGGMNVTGPSTLGRKASKASVTSLTKMSDDGLGSDSGSLKSHTRESLANSSWSTYQTDDDELSNFVKMVDSHLPLNIFSKHGSSGSRMGSSVTSGGMGDSMSSLAASGVSTKAALSRFRALKDTHNTLSESMAPDALFLTAEPDATAASPTDRHATTNATSSSPGSSSTLSLQGRAHQPAIPSPLHAEATSSQRSRHSRQSRPLSMTGVRTDQLLPTQSVIIDNGAGNNENDYPTYSSFPEDVHHQERHHGEARLRHHIGRRTVHDESEDIDAEDMSRGDTSLGRSDQQPLSSPTPEVTGTYSASTSSAALSRAIRRYPSSSVNSISSISSTRGGTQMARRGSNSSLNDYSSSVLGGAGTSGSTSARVGSVEDDDSEVFVMSEISPDPNSNPPSAGTTYINMPFIPTTGPGSRMAPLPSIGSGVYGEHGPRSATAIGGTFAESMGVVVGPGLVGPFARGTGEDMVRRGSGQSIAMGTLMEEEERSTESGSGVVSRSGSASSNDSSRRSSSVMLGRVGGTVLTTGSRGGSRSAEGSKSVDEERRESDEDQAEEAKRRDGDGGGGGGPYGGFEGGAFVG